MRREKVIDSLSKRHEDTEVRYTCCAQNGCWDSACILKCEVRDGKIVSLCCDDSINAGNPREDVGDDLEYQGMVQMRPCAMGHSWKSELEREQRILYPMKRVGEKGPGKGHFERISWDEALDTIADKLKEYKETYGPYSICHSIDDVFNDCGFRLSQWFGMGMAAWGDSSCSGTTPGEIAHLGFDMVDSFHGLNDVGVGFEAPDLYNSNLIVMWGMDPLIGWYGPVSYYMMRQHERGAKVIVIDPRYTNSAETLADQWIPIRPGTDIAMLLATAYILYSQDLYDHEFVEKWVEPEGFEKWRRYVMGEVDGVAKTPEWAETICAVPAETIRGFAELYASSKPAHLHFYYAPAKRHLGEYAASAAMLLQAMTGNLAIPGGCETGCSLITPARIPVPEVDWQQTPGSYEAPVCYNIQKIADAILQRPRFDAGEITEEEYRIMIGSPAGSPLPNIKMMILENQYPISHHHSNKRIDSIMACDFVWGWQWHMDQISVEYMDIVLPAVVMHFESLDNYQLGSERFMYGPNGMRNYFVYADKICDRPGEVRPNHWIYTQLAKRLGCVEQYNPRMADVDIEDWDDEIEKLYIEAYDKWKDTYGEAFKAIFNIDIKPWEEFKKMPVVRIPMLDGPFYPYKNYMEGPNAGKSPFKTETGLVEFSSKYIENTDTLHDSRYRGGWESYPVYDPSYMEGQPANDSFYNPKAEQYPLSLVTPVSAYRQHACLDGNPELRDEVYRHAMWLAPSDAKARGIKDGDPVRAFNEFGEVRLCAYVTSRMTPGTAAIFHGAWPHMDQEKTNETMPYGMDMRGMPNFLIGDTHAPHIVGALFTAGLVQAEKIKEEQA